MAQWQSRAQHSHSSEFPSITYTNHIQNKVWWLIHIISALEGLEKDYLEPESSWGYWVSAYLEKQKQSNFCCREWWISVTLEHCHADCYPVKGEFAPMLVIPFLRLTRFHWSINTCEIWSWISFNCFLISRQSTHYMSTYQETLYNQQCTLFL